jgi:2-dehydropantoate 2-reductase
MRIAIFGAGGVGGYLGGLLVRAGHEVSFLARGEHLQAIQKHGLVVKSVNGDFAVKPAVATSDPVDIGEVDYVIVAVKHFQLEQVAKQMEPLLGAMTTVVPLQNGVDAHEILIRYLGHAPVVGGFTSIVSMIESPGVIHQPSKLQHVSVGELDRKRSDRCQRIVHAWKECGIDAFQPDDIFIPMWKKFIFIASYGGVSSLAQVPSGDLLVCQESKQLFVRAAEEIEALGHAEGIDLPADVVPTALTTLENFESTTTSSMQRDVAAGKPFELEAFSGTIVRLGKEHGVPTPVHEVLYGLLRPTLLRVISKAR